MRALFDAVAVEQEAKPPGSEPSRGMPTSSVIGGQVRVNIIAWVFGVGFCLAMAVVIARVGMLKVSPDAELASRLYDCVAVKSLPARRGDIVDRRSRLLAMTRFAPRAVADPTLLPLDVDRHVPAIADAVGGDPGEVGDRIMRAIAANRAKGWVHADERPSGKTDTEIRRELIGLLQEKIGVPLQTAESDDVTGLSRYVRLSGPLSEEQAQTLRRLKITGLTVETSPVREYPASGSVAAIVGKLAAEPEWNLGVERARHEILEGTSGRVVWVHDAGGDPLWIERGALTPPEPGEDVRLTIDLEVQRIVEEELAAGVEKADAAGGRAVVIDPATGDVLAVTDVIREVPGLVEFPWSDKPKPGERAARLPDNWRERCVTIRPDPGRRSGEPALSRVRCVTDVFEPGSIFKPFVWASLSEMKAAGIDEKFETGGWWVAPNRRTIRDVVGPALRTWEEVLINSSNIGMSKVAMRVPEETLRRAVLGFGFGSLTGIGAAGESAGLVPSPARWGDYTQQSVAFGQEIAVTPVQMARAFCVFARGGDMAGTMPPLRLIDEDGTDVVVCERVLSVETAIMTRDILEVVADKMLSKYTRLNRDAPRPVFGLAGKSGTAQIPVGQPPEGKRLPPGRKGFFEKQYISSFLAAAPADEPRLVILVMIEDPGPSLVDANRYYGSDVAGPVVSRIADRALLYLGVAPRGREMMASSSAATR